MDRFRKFLERVGQAGPSVQCWLTFPVEKSDVMLFSGVADLFVGLEPGKPIIAPRSCELPGDPGVRRLADGDRPIRWLVGRNDHRSR